MSFDLLSGGTSTDPYPGLDRFGRVIDGRWLRPLPVSSSSSVEIEDVERIEYGYDRANNRLWRNNVVASEQYAGGNDELYAYDGLQRLIDMSRGNLAEGDRSIEDVSYAQNWRLDATGNWPGFKRRVMR